MRSKPFAGALLCLALAACGGGGEEGEGSVELSAADQAKAASMLQEYQAARTAGNPQSAEAAADKLREKYPDSAAAHELDATLDEVRKAAEVAFAHVREGNGPVLMELNTYRYRGHSMSDPAKYRTREEVQNVREHSDPIEGAKAELIKMGVDEDKLKDIDKRIKAQVAEAADFAESSPLPAESELYTDVLVGSY